MDPGEGLPEERLSSLRRLARGPTALLSPWQDLDLRRLWKVLLHSVLVGALAGGFVCLFFYTLEWATWLTLDHWAHLGLPRPGGERTLTPPPPGGEVRWWLLPILPAVGGLLCGLLVRFADPTAGGPGGDAFIGTFHFGRARFSKRTPFVKALASLVTIGSGGAAGREGPTLLVSAGIGSLLSRALRLSEKERRILLVAGAAAGTGAMFRTPLAAALFAVEVLYRDDFESDAIVPSILASVTGYSVVTLVFGSAPLFSTDARYVFDPRALPLYAAMALGLCLFGALYVKMRQAVALAFKRSKLPAWLSPAVGGLLLGLCALLVPQVLGTGYGLAQSAITGGPLLRAAGDRAFLLLFGFALTKMLATSLTVSSGGSGGDMGPSIVIGGLVGGAFGTLFHEWFPELAPQPGAFALVGMGAFFGGIAHVPVSSLVMVCELAGSYDLLAPLMLAEGIAFVVLRHVTVYPSQVPGRIHSPAHRDEVTVDILESKKVRDVYHPELTLAKVSPATPARQVLDALSSTELPALLVVDAQDHVVGIVSLETVRALLAEEFLDGLVAADMLMPTQQLVLDDDLHTALHAFLEADAVVLPVEAERGGRVVGVLTHADVDRAYEAAVEERLGPIPDALRTHA